MSRTYKDIKRVKLKLYYKEHWDTEYTRIHYYFLKKAGVTPKKRKEVDTEDHWMSTPGWWIKMMMNKPERVKANMLSRRAVTEFGSMLEWIDIPDTRRKPHIYYW